jgi:hypothetical protein
MVCRSPYVMMIKMLLCDATLKAKGSCQARHIQADHLNQLAGEASNLMCHAGIRRENLCHCLPLHIQQQPSEHCLLLKNVSALQTGTIKIHVLEQSNEDWAFACRTHNRLVLSFKILRSVVIVEIYQIDPTASLIDGWEHLAWARIAKESMGMSRIIKVLLAIHTRADGIDSQCLKVAWDCQAFF